MKLENFKKMFTKKLKKSSRGKEEKINYSQLKNLIKKKNAILIDVRSPQEYQEGHLNYAINMPSYEISKQITNKVANKDSLIIVYCQTGNRSSKVIEELKNLNYKNIYELEGGLEHIY